MLKLLIVDDEPIILEGLQKAIDWAKCGFEVIDTAANGLIGLEKIKQLSPDAVITDVRMQFMDGLELIRKTKELSDDISFIVLSAYNDFEYAKEACDLGAFSYISKPFDEEQIFQVMDSLRKTISKKREAVDRLVLMSRLLKEQEKEIEERLIRDIFKQQLSPVEIEAKIRFLNTTLDSDCHYIVGIARINDFGNEESKEIKDKEMVLFAIRQMMIDIIKDKFSVTGVILDVASIGILISLKYLSDTDRSECDELLHRAAKLIKENLGVFITVSKGCLYKGYDGIAKSYREACKAMELSYIMGASHLLDIKDTGMNVDDPYKYPYKIEYDIIQAIKMGDLKRFHTALAGFIDFFKNENNFHAQIIFSLQYLFISIFKAFMESGSEWINKYPVFEVLISEMHKASVKKTTRIISDFVEEFITQDFNSKHKIMKGMIHDIMKMALGYIEKNISNTDLNIRKVSEQIHLNPVYFGRLFKKELNVSFVEYITKLRIDKAKTILADTQGKVIEVAAEVGIDNLSYFNVLFKKYTGVTPVEYKNEVGKSHG